MTRVHEGETLRASWSDGVEETSISMLVNQGDMPDIYDFGLGDFGFWPP
ncbi:hypothetical protein [Streptomyces sp. MP131-18]|nr:hypothetical protein [Streptomyces sp. MP131-18]ONK12205.1 hypothetical protein STBA_29450 [Streptomyces sp. MP131-18]